uniref:RNA-directed DNA polymerase homolog n=1 Tax=Nicotiana tabacum TaxID=4097 RepID=A0A1S3YP89_TOBAC|nr:PREDICTED: uncharacterized protein LOC107778210 [Nicotiana tabacum]
MLEAVLLNFDDDEMDGFMEYVNSLQRMGFYNYAPRKLSLDLKNRKTPPTKPSIEEPPILELESLPPHLRMVTDWRVCMDYRNKVKEGSQGTLNKVIWKDHFLLPFMDQMLDKLAGRAFYCFLDAIFPDMVEDYLEVFMDDFLVVGDSFDDCLSNLDKVLARFEETNLVLNREKYYFMVEEGIVFGYKILKNDIEVD